MVFNTITVGAAVTPAIIETYFSHVYINNATPLGPNLTKCSISIENRYVRNPPLMSLTTKESI